MKAVIYYLGKTFQIIGMGTVFIAFISFFWEPKMGEMFKITFVGIVEFYLGYFMVASSGEKGE